MAPASTISFAVAAPIPRAAPDRNATLPSSLFILCSLLPKLVESYILVDAHVGRQAEHALRHNVAQNLVGAAGDAEARATDPLRLEARSVRHIFLHDAGRTHQLHGERAHVLHLGRRHDLDDRGFRPW